MPFTAIRASTAEGVMTIALARPDKLNAFTTAMHAELRDALDTAESEDTVRCLATHDATEGVTAFREKRAPRYLGR